MIRNNYRRLLLKEQQDLFHEVFGEISYTTEDTFKIKRGGRTHKTKLGAFIYAELLLYVAHSVYKRAFNMDELLVLFSGLHNSFLQVDEETDKMIAHAHTLLADFKDEWDKRSCILNFYFKQTDCVVKDSMLFVSNGDSEKWFEINDRVRLYTDRVDGYQKLLYDNKYIEFIKAKPKGFLDEYLVKRICEKCEYSIEERVSKVIQSIDEEYIRQMDELIDNPKYLSNYLPIELEEINRVSKGMQHIAGGTGTGKSILFDIYIKKLTESGLKVLYITDSHASNSINTKIRFDELGIRSNIIMGKRRDEHINKFIQSKEGRSIAEIIVEYKDLFLNIDYTCRNSDSLQCHKCERSIEATKGMCGFFKMYKRIEGAEAIITTPHNLLASTAADRVDTHRRSVYEMLTIWADVVLLDEVDKLQEIADDIFVDNTHIYSLDAPGSAKSENLESFMNFIHNTIMRKNVVQSENVKAFKYDVLAYDKEIDMLHILFFDPERATNVIREWVGSRDFSIMQLVYEWCEDYISSVRLKNGDELDQEKFNNRMYAVLYYKIKIIRKTIIENLIEEYDDDSIEIPDIFTSLFVDFKKVVGSIGFEDEEVDALKIQQIDLEQGEIKINFKHTREISKRNERLAFIILLASIDQYSADLYERFRGVAEDIKKSGDDFVRVPLSIRNHLLAPRPLIQDADGFKIKIDYSGTQLIKQTYAGIGREILFNIPKTVGQIYGIEKPYMFITSATGAGTGSSLYSVKYPVNYLIDRKDYPEARVNVKCHIFYQGDEPIRISGASLQHQGMYTKILTKKVIEKIIKPKVEDMDTGFLVCVSSYASAKYVLEEFIKMNIDARALYDVSMGDFDSNIHINKLDIEKEAKNTKVFIAVDTIIARGYNIVIKGKSYFRDIILMNRKMPNPHDLKEKVSYLHQFISKPQIGSYKETKSNMYQIRNKMRHVESYRSCPKVVKAAIIGNTFTLVKQIAGRGQRGGTQVTLHLVDAAFYPDTAADVEAVEIIDTKATSIFKGWQELVDTDDRVVNKLYGDMKYGLSNYELIRHR